MLKTLTEKIKKRKQEKERNKNQFELNKLYVGEIVLFKKSVHVKDKTYNNYFTHVKKVAILTGNRYSYRHIKSQQILSELGKYDSIVGDFALINIKTFPERFPIYMRKNNLQKSTKVSQAFIENFEEEMNKKLDPKQEIDELFI